jgi:isopenicillin-N N-acyltransferase like protein
MPAGADADARLPATAAADALIPLLRVAGTHREVGRQLGSLTGDTVRRAAAAPFDAELVERYRAVTLRHVPWVVEELDGVAEGAGADPLAVFAASIEELASAPEPAPSRCTDLAACATAARDGHVLVAHNNDYYASDEEDVVAIEWRVPGEPTCFTLGMGPWLSVGWNDAGLSVTGNELSPADERVGIPRLLQMRDVVRRRTLDEAVECVLHPARASSYNWVFAHRDGGIVDVEGTGGDAELLEPADGVLAHTNHYTHERLQPLDRNVAVAKSSKRLGRAEQLLDAREAPVTLEWLRDALSDHEGAPDSLCRHGGSEGVKTIFWCVADVTAGEIRYGRGTPCTSEAAVYRFGW